MYIRGIKIAGEESYLPVTSEAFFSVFAALFHTPATIPRRITRFILVLRDPLVGCTLHLLPLDSLSTLYSV